MSAAPPLLPVGSNVNGLGGVRGHSGFSGPIRESIPRERTERGGGTCGELHLVARPGVRRRHALAGPVEQRHHLPVGGAEFGADRRRGQSRILLPKPLSVNGRPYAVTRYVLRPWGVTRVASSSG